MNKTIIKLSLAVFAIGFTNMLYAQDEPKEENVRKEILNWYNGGGTGMYTEKAYKKLKGRKSSTVVVAIIDSGIDIEHKDLQGKIWTNTGEIAGNGIDDDMNGYIDDVHGVYYDASELATQVGAESAYLSNPAVQNTSWFATGQQRGDNENDTYFYVNILFSRNITYKDYAKSRRANKWRGRYKF